MPDLRHSSSSVFFFEGWMLVFARQCPRLSNVTPLLDLSKPRPHPHALVAGRCGMCPPTTATVHFVGSPPTSMPTGKPKDIKLDPNPPWRNWLARQTVNLEVLSSTLSGGDLCCPDVLSESSSFCRCFFVAFGGGRASTQCWLC